jgi:hypothetical protein
MQVIEECRKNPDISEGIENERWRKLIKDVTRSVKMIKNCRYENSKLRLL